MFICMIGSIVPVRPSMIAMAIVSVVLILPAMLVVFAMPAMFRPIMVGFVVVGLAVIRFFPAAASVDHPAFVVAVGAAGSDPS